MSQRDRHVTEVSIVSLCLYVAQVIKAPSPNKPQRKVIVTANAGDSDVALFRFAANEHGHSLMTTEWLTKEHALHSDEERARAICGGGVLADAAGRDAAAHRVCVKVLISLSM